MIADTALYLWGGYAMAIALLLTEILVLRIRYMAIREDLHLGHSDGQSVAEPDGNAEAARSDPTA